MQVAGKSNNVVRVVRDSGKSSKSNNAGKGGIVYKSSKTVMLVEV